MTTLALPDKSTRSLSEFEFLHDPDDAKAKLGKGSFACVKLAREKKTGNLLALKMVISFEQHIYKHRLTAHQENSILLTFTTLRLRSTSIKS